MSKKRALSLLLFLLVLTLVLTSCGISTDPETGEPVVDGIFAIIANPLADAVTFVSDFLARLGLTQTIGWAIILVTIGIRLLLYPLTRKQMQSMRKMQEIQPQMKELQEKYGKDREKLAQKQMELYQREGVNPAMGCLPLLIQMPFLFGFYYALITLGSTLEQSFLWLPDLSLPHYQEGLSWLQPYSFEHFTSPDVWPYLTLPILYVITQLIIQRMSQASNPTSSSGPMGNVMMLMPVAFAYITLITPAGLSIYWITTNIIQIVQQGFSTGWDSLLPGRKKAEEVGSGKPAKGGQAAIPAPEPTPPTTDISAGRRRKMRKKKR